MLVKGDFTRLFSFVCLFSPQVMASFYFFFPPEQKLSFCRSPNIPWKWYRLIWPAGQPLDRRWRSWEGSPAFCTGQKRTICTPLWTVVALFHGITLASSTRKSGDNQSPSCHTWGCRLQRTAMAWHSLPLQCILARKFHKEPEGVLNSYPAEQFLVYFWKYTGLSSYCTHAEPIPAIPVLQIIILEIKLIHSV